MNLSALYPGFLKFIVYFHVGSIRVRESSTYVSAKIQQFSSMSLAPIEFLVSSPRQSLNADILMQTRKYEPRESREWLS